MTTLSSAANELSAASGFDLPHKTNALTVEHFCRDEDVDYHVSSKREMLSILNGIAEQGSRVCVYYGDDQHFILTTLLCVNERGLWLDVGPFSAENKQLLQSDKIVFVSLYQNLKIQFVVRKIEYDVFDNNGAFHIGLPDYLLRIQRREFFRSAMPSPDLVKCLIPIQSESPDDPKVIRAVPLMDISGGGIQLLCDADEESMLPNNTFPDCQISIPDVGTLTVTIEVRNSISFTADNNVALKRIGCRFVQLDNQINIPLQRHLIRLQSESMARRHQAVFS